MKGLESPHLPWHNRFPLTAEDAARIVAADVPALSPCRALRQGEGWDYAAFRINDDWIFRFPKRHQAGRALMREVRTLGALRDAADLPLGIPDYLWVVEFSTGFPAPYAGYTFLPGRALLELDARAVDAETVARQLGRFLARLHAATPTSRPRGVCDDFAAYFTDFRSELEAAAPGLPQTVHAACRALLATPPAPWRGPPAFVHGDLGAEHVLCDGTGHPSAVIDWGDAGWGNPLGDYVGLWAWGGDTVAAAALAAAGRTLGAADWRRLRTWGACYAIGTFHYGYKDGQEAVSRAGLEWLVRMERAGQLQDPGREDA